MSFHSSLLIVDNLPSKVITVLIEELPQLLIFLAGLVLYTLFIWKLFKHISKRDLFKLNEYFGEGKLRNFREITLYILKYLIIVPIYIFIWFAIFALFLFLLSKIPTIENILLISISIVATIRVAAYFDQELAEDLAKLIPLAMLAIFITDPSFFNLQLFMIRLQTLPILQAEILSFVIFTIAIEWILRIFYSIKVRLNNKKIVKPEPLYGRERFFR